MRVHELAKELSLHSKDVVDRLTKLGAQVSSHMSTVDDATATLLRNAIKGGEAGKEVPAKPKVAHDIPKSESPVQKHTPAPAPKAVVSQVHKSDTHSTPQAVAHPVAKTEAHPAPKTAVHPAHKPDTHSTPQAIVHPVPKVAVHHALKVEAHPAVKIEPPAPVVVAPILTEAGKSTADDKTIALRGGAIVVKDLAEKLKLRPNQLIAELMAINVFASISDRIDIKVAQKIASKRGITLEHEKKAVEHKPVQKAWDEEEPADKPEDLETRPPIVTFLGHVDHGKTSLLDRIRKTMVAKGEAGGITQHIGAYMVEVHGRKITFLDTPGHAAFTSMRARGAHLTDIAVIIIAADDGVMPQTIEAIQHAKAANACIMVAINKTDLPNVNVDRVKKQLQGLELSPEEWGGTTIVSEVSAITGNGIDHLLEMILLQADMLDLKVSRKRRADGYVIEAQLEAGMGPTASLLVKRGCLKVGDIVLCGHHLGRVKALINDHGIRVRTADPSTPIKCLGLSGVPEAGSHFSVCVSEKLAREIAEERHSGMKAQQIFAPKKASLESLYQDIKTAEVKELRLVVKADVQGSVEAIRHALDGIKSEKASLKLILCGVGNITTNDTLLASASSAVVVGFNVSKETGVNAVAKREGVEIRLHSIIYNLVDEIRASMTGLLDPKLKETIIGRAEVIDVFAVSKVGTIAGCRITAGRVTSKSLARVSRSGEIIHDGKLISLRRFQNDASEVKDGQECGLRLDNFGTFEKGDTLEFYEIIKIAQVL